MIARPIAPPRDAAAHRCKPGHGALNGLTSNYNGSRVDYRLSVDYRFSPAVLAYATYSTGFKGGGVTPRPFTAAQALKGNFQPETLTNYEVGLKTDLFDRKLQFNIDGYIDNYKNIQAPISDCSPLDGISPDPFPCGAVQNVGSDQLKGVEAEVQFHPDSHLTLDGSASYIHGKRKTLSPTVGSANVQFNDPVLVVPTWQASGGAQYKVDLGDGSGSITPRVDFTYQNREYTGRALGFQYYIPGYTLVNARLTWQNDRKDLEISGSVTNLTDKYHYENIFPGVYTFSGTAYETVGHPREWMLTLKKKF